MIAIALALVAVQPAAGADQAASWSLLAEMAGKGYVIRSGGWHGMAVDWVRPGVELRQLSVAKDGKLVDCRIVLQASGELLQRCDNDDLTRILQPQSNGSVRLALYRDGQKLGSAIHWKRGKVPGSFTLYTLKYVPLDQAPAEAAAIKARVEQLLAAGPPRSEPEAKPVVESPPSDQPPV